MMILVRCCWLILWIVATMCSVCRSNALHGAAFVATTTKTTKRAPPTGRRRSFVTTQLASGSKEDEIAELEAKLKQLKQEQAASSAEAEATPPPDQTKAAAVMADDDAASPEEFMFSERWKVDDESSSEGGGGLSGALTGILGAVGLAVALTLFSQVPVGQESMSKYAAIDAPKVQQIDLGDLNRARSSGNGDL